VDKEVKLLATMNNGIGKIYRQITMITETPDKILLLDYGPEVHGMEEIDKEEATKLINSRLLNILESYKRDEIRLKITVSDNELWIRTLGSPNFDELTIRKGLSPQWDIAIDTLYKCKPPVAAVINFEGCDIIFNKTDKITVALAKVVTERGAVSAHALR